MHIYMYICMYLKCLEKEGKGWNYVTIIELKDKLHQH